jgi:Spy/CpxP family protein refolding chaperone
MVISSKLKVYGIVIGIFVLGAGAGGAAGYAVASKRVAEVLGDDRPEAHEARRFEALARELDLTREQRQKVRAIMERHRDENRTATKAVFEKCGEEMQKVRERTDKDIAEVLTPEQQQRFKELMDKRGKRFPLGGPGRFRKGDGRHD